MVILEQLRVHVGGIVRLKGELFWYGGRGWDGITGRVCLLLDAAPNAPARGPHARVPRPLQAGAGTAAAALLLIDGRPQWVWVAPADVELL